MDIDSLIISKRLDHRALRLEDYVTHSVGIFKFIDSSLTFFLKHFFPHEVFEFLGILILAGWPKLV